MARISSEKAVNAIGNRFNLVLAASQRARELKSGHAPRITDVAGPIVTALREIEEGKYTLKEFLDTIPRKQKGHRE